MPNVFCFQKVIFHLPWTHFELCSLVVVAKQFQDFFSVSTQNFRVFILFCFCCRFRPKFCDERKFSVPDFFGLGVATMKIETSFSKLGWKEQKRVSSRQTCFQKVGLNGAGMLEKWNFLSERFFVGKLTEGDSGGSGCSSYFDGNGCGSWLSLLDLSQFNFLTVSLLFPFLSDDWLVRTEYAPLWLDLSLSLPSLFLIPSPSLQLPLFYYFPF